MSQPNPMNATQELCDLAAEVVELAKRAGADEVETQCRDGVELVTNVRMGEVDMVKQAGVRAVGLRVFVDRKTAVTYTSDLRPCALRSFAERAVALARQTESDDLNTLPPSAPTALLQSSDNLELWDEGVFEIDTGWALDVAMRAETAARGVDPRVQNSDGARVSKTVAATAFANSAGFLGAYRGTYMAIIVQPLCQDDDGKQRSGHAWSAARFLDDLDEPEDVGIEASRQALAKLGARPVPSTEVPVVFAPEAGRSLVRAFFAAANGSSFVRRSSYLVDREETLCASELVNIVDDPLRPRAPGSRPFDGEGMSSRVNRVVERGTLKTVLCDSHTARRLGRASTHSARRSVGGTPVPGITNLLMQPGSSSPEELVSSMKRGFVVTDLMGSSFSAATGDFSRGASGQWIEQGEIAHAVSEVTISGNLDEMLKRVDGVADDLVLRTVVACPTFRVSNLTLAGTNQ